MKRFVILATGLAASAGLAQPPAAAPRANASADPNEVVCQRVQIIGSRLNNARVCRTRAEWEAQRQADRENTEQAQRRGIVPR